MKHLIIEGPDRVGKDTLIKNLLSHFSNVAVRHFRSPKGDSDDQKKQYQQISFSKEYSSLHTLEFLQFDLCIWNRGHLGEFVYGNLYRKTDPESWVIQQEENSLPTDIVDTYLLLLTADPEFLSSKDDGLSFDSSSDARKNEIDQFRKAVELSTVKNKLELKVDFNDKFGNKTYLHQDLILRRTLNFLNGRK